MDHVRLCLRIMNNSAHLCGTARALFLFGGASALHPGPGLLGIASMHH
jgi:hypothetical protein